MLLSLLRLALTQQLLLRIMVILSRVLMVGATIRRPPISLQLLGVHQMAQVDGTPMNEIVFDDIYLVETLCDAHYSDGTINGGVVPDGVGTLAYGEATHSAITL